MTYNLSITQKTLLLLSALSLAAMLHQYAAWAFLLISYIWLWRNSQQQAFSIVTLMLVILTLHHLLGYTITHSVTFNLDGGYSYHIPLPMNDLDSVTYHRNTVIYNSYSSPWNFGIFYSKDGLLLGFEALLKYCYLITPSWFMGAEILILFFTSAMINFRHLLNLMDVSKTWQLLALALFGLTPQILLWTSITVRTSLALAILISLTILIMTSMRRETSWPRFITTSLTCGIGLSLLHPGTMMMATLILPIAFLIRAPLTSATKRKTVLILGLIMITIITLPIINHQTILSVLKDKLITFRENSALFIGNTNYLASAQFYPVMASWLGFFIHSGKLFLHYVFGPFPWELSHYAGNQAKVGIIMLYSWGKIMMMCIISYSYYHESKLMKNDYLLLGFVYLVITGLFSIGTFNYTQALRHHALSDWIIFLLFAHALSHTNLDFFLKLLPQKSSAKNV